MKWTVEQAYFDAGQVRIRVRKATEGEVDTHKEMKKCCLFIDVFDTKKEAETFADRCSGRIEAKVELHLVR